MIHQLSCLFRSETYEKHTKTNQLQVKNKDDSNTDKLGVPCVLMLQKIRKSKLRTFNILQ